MKAKLNITIEENLLESIKDYAGKKKVSLSQLIEKYFEAIIQSTTNKKSIIDIVDKLEPNLDVIKASYKKEAFYETQKEKYGI